MFERVEEWFLDDPERIISLGYALIKVAGLLIMFGLVGHVVVIVTNMSGGFIGVATPTKMLSEIYQSFPTWWIPETYVGAALAVTILITGVWIQQTGIRLKRFVRYYH
jgi:hypothetical protein